MELDTNNDTAVITTYFNPCAYHTKRVNYNIFAEGIAKSKAVLVTIEGLFGNSAFELPEGPTHIKIRASDILWQKERLLNVVIDQLPCHISKVVWADCDLIFENENWLEQTRQLLDTYKVVQPFEIIVQLPQDHYDDDGSGDRHVGFAATFTRNPLSLTVNQPGNRHGHSGYVWAAQRKVLAHGLYDVCISGNGDHLMAHAFVGDWETECFRSHFEDNPLYWNHFKSWCEKIYPTVRANINYVPGKLLHLWHGKADGRKYMDRNRELNVFEFDPAMDLLINENGSYQWATNKPDLHRWAKKYFQKRNEDGTVSISFQIQELVDRLGRAMDRAASAAHRSHLQTAINLIDKATSIEEAIAISRSALGIRN